MTKLLRKTLERVTPQSFSPYGRLIGHSDEEPTFRRDFTYGWKMDFQGARPEFMPITTDYRPLRFSEMERHFNVTQAFIRLGGVPCVLALAAPTDAADRKAIPEPADIRLFLLDDVPGYILHVGTWHSPHRYPLYPPHATWLSISDHETTAEQVESTRDVGFAGAARENWKLTQVVDYKRLQGVEFAVEL